ncbi:MAG: hypothetical protein QOE97_1762 [Pseudonocardiales bacterium]|jgi:hypothetical protein|nr:hypothetical protein [Pseudonocardiales bacterium]
MTAHRTTGGKPNRRRRIVLAGIASVALLATGAGIAFAVWSTSGAGAASAPTATLNAPSITSVTSASGTGSVSVAWSPSATSASAPAPAGYYVTRKSGATSAPACGSSPSSLISGPTCTDSTVADGTYTYVVTAVLHSWSTSSSPSAGVTVTNIVPTATVNQASGQPDPARTSPINFTVVFNEPVVDFTSGAVTVGGTAVGTASVTISGSGPTYNVAVSGMTTSGTVSASIGAGKVHDANGTANSASTSTDNSVTWDGTAPTAPKPTFTAATVSGSNPTYVSSEALTFSDAATDDTGGTGVQSVAYFYCAGSGGCGTGGTQLGSASSTGPSYAVTSPVPAFANGDGPYSVVAVVTDNAGNQTRSAAAVIALDSTKPSAPAPTVNGSN